MEPHSRLATRYPSTTKRHGPAHDEPGSPGVSILQTVPRALVPELQVCHGGRLHQQPPVLLFYSAWLAERGEAWDGPLVPHLEAGAVRQLAQIGGGCQVGAMTHRAALPPLLPFNFDPGAHFGRALQRAQQPLPYEDLPVFDLDLEYVADAYAAPRA